MARMLMNAVIKIKKDVFNEGDLMKVVLVRHGESVWNLENRFTGWTDVDLSEKGIIEAKEAGTKLKKLGYTFDVAFTSVLKRANKTLDYILEELNLDIPIYYSWRLNERHYGALQGLNKAETAEKYGADQVLLWRRSLNTRPPKLEEDDSRYPGHDPKYSELSEAELPLTENLLDTVDRVVPYWEGTIVPELRAKKKVIIVAHGNSLRALVKYLDHISDDEIMAVEIPTGKPLVYELDDETLEALKHYYI